MDTLTSLLMSKPIGAVLCLKRVKQKTKWKGERVKWVQRVESFPKSKFLRIPSKFICSESKIIIVNNIFCEDFKNG